ncbi:HEPN domain-containing protein [Shewanella oncorhynchi]|uniref:HEPN domain-containing protein n=1 Tax=Shewanella oncorhynchi TaxID=2726434 RepID=UPI003D7A8FDB
MTSNQYEPSEFLIEYRDGINKIGRQTKDDFHNKLYFSNVVSLMEKYLYDLFVHEITTDRSALVKLGMTNKFKSESLKIPYLLHNNIEDFIVNAVKNFVWHRLNDVDVFFKNVLLINFNLNGKLLALLKVRHDIVHRNGFDLEGNPVIISDQDLLECMTTITAFIEDIDKKYKTNKN